MIRIPPILCAKCQRPADSVAVHFDPGKKGYHIVVDCHGAVDDMFMPMSMLQSGPIMVVSAVAFAPKDVRLDLPAPHD